MKAIRYLLSFALTLSALCAETNQGCIDAFKSTLNRPTFDIGYDFTEADLEMVRAAEDPGLPAEECVVGNAHCRFLEKLDLLTRLQAKLGADIEQLKATLITAPTQNFEALQEFLSKYNGLIPLETIHKGFQETKKVFNDFANDLAARADTLVEDEHPIDLSDTQKQQILSMHGEFKKSVNKLIDQFDPIAQKIEKFKQNFVKITAASALDDTLRILVDEITNTCDDLLDLCCETQAALGPKVDIAQSAFSKWVEDHQETILTGLGFTASAISYATSEYYIMRFLKPYSGVASHGIITAGGTVALQTAFMSLLEIAVDQSIWWLDEIYKPKFDKFIAYGIGAAAYAIYTYYTPGNSPAVIASRAAIPTIYACIAAFRWYTGLDATNTHVKQGVKTLETIIPLVTAAILVNGFHMPWQVAH